jgi:hypothetical protein
LIGALLALLLAGPSPDAVGLIVVIRSGSDWCHASPIGITQLLTASHCVGKEGTAEFSGQGIEGEARLAWRDEKRDLAMLPTERPQAWRIIAISKRAPGPAAQAWGRTFLPRLRSVVVPLTILGVDDDADYDLVGYAPPGTSGSGLLDDAGDLVGVVKLVFNPWSIGQRPQTVIDIISVLENAVKFAPAVAATPIREWPKP